MRVLRVLLARLAGVFTGQRSDDELSEELQAHLDMEIADNIRRGMPPKEARRQALLASGGLVQAAEAVREQRGLPWLETTMSDIRYALRALRHTPGFTFVVVITLALGIGANAAIFSVVRGVLLKPLPHRAGDRLMYLRHSIDGLGGKNINFSVPEVRDLRNGVPAFAGLAEYSPFAVLRQSDEGGERLSVGLVTGNYFEVMGLGPVLGRLTRPSDDGPGVPIVMVLTYDYWQKRFGGDPGIVGRQLRFDGKLVTIIGVLQPAPFFPKRIDALCNMVMSEHHLSAAMVEVRVHRMTEIVARLAPNATVQEARAQVAAVQSRQERDFKEAYDPSSHYRVAVIPFKEVLGEDARTTLLLLMAAAAFVLIISAANVANLTLMRGVRRERELVVRAALGAGVSRLRRLLIAENMVLTLMGAALGVGIALSGVKLLVSFAERYSPRAGEIRLDSVVLAFMLALSVVLALLLSFLASLPREGKAASWITAGANRSTGSLQKNRLQRALVVVQIAVSVVLLAGAGLLTRTLMRLSNVDTGLSSEQVLTMQVTLLSDNERRSNKTAAATARQRFEEMRKEIAALPGVLDVGIGSTLPLRTAGMVFDFKAEGKTLGSGEGWPRADARSADPHYFSAAGIPLLKGRAFLLADEPNEDNVVIINKTLADHFFPPGVDPIGRRIAFTGEPISTLYPEMTAWRTVIGVVGDTRDAGPDVAPQSVVFTPQLQAPANGGIVIRARGTLSGLDKAATQIVRKVEPGALIEDVMTIQQFKEKRVSPRRLNAVLISSFGALALLIAVVGIGGVLAFSVSARTNEIGIRMSLGADSPRIQRMILGEGGALLVFGLGLGVVGALFAARAIRGLLFGVEPYDAVTFSAVALLMATIGLAACWIPALRASRIDPATTMRA